jgi:hypothetical protein
MKFRHHLAKETFKGKKKTSSRGVEDHIADDQRGNHTSAQHEPNILSLDKDTITPPPPLIEEEPREMSRRDMFSFGNFLDFGAAVEDEAQKTGNEVSQESLEVDEEPELPADLELDKEPLNFQRISRRFQTVGLKWVAGIMLP